MSSSNKRKTKFSHKAYLSAYEEVRFQQALEAYRQSVQAREYGDSESAFIKYAILGEGARAMPLRKSPRPKTDLPAVQELVRLQTALARSGNNLNQIARMLHSGRRPAPKWLGAAMAEHRRACLAIREALGLKS
jgi:hypothetical protein